MTDAGQTGGRAGDRPRPRRRWKPWHTACYANDDLEAPIASGSFLTMGMVVAPCSIKSLSAIAHCHTETLLVRAADVVLKERRRLVLAVRETPLHLGHLRLMTTVTEYGAVVLPPIPGFYHGPKSVDDVVDHTVGKILDQFGVEHALYKRWEDEDDGWPGRVSFAPVWPDT